MKVLQINTVYKNGGSTGRIVADLHNHGISQQVDMYVAYGYEFKHLNKEDYYNTYKICSILQMQWSKLKTRLFARHGFYNYSGTKKLLQWIDFIKPDIIHLHNLHNHYLNIELLFKYIKQKNIPVVWTLHDCWSFTGWCAYFDMAHCNKWINGCNGKCPCKHDYPYTWFFNRSSQNFIAKRALFTGIENMTIVTPSQWLADLCKKSFLGEYPIRVINNGVDTNTFSPTYTDIRSKYDIPINAKIILSVMNVWNKRKGTEYLLEIPQHLKGNEYLIIVGLKPEQIKKLPQQHCIGISRTDNVNELAALYTEASVFINPTLEDNFPTTNIESLACGTPVITFATGGSIESVSDNENSKEFNGYVKTNSGAIIYKKDTQTLLSAIRNIYNDKEEYYDFCIQKAFDKYNKVKQYDKYIELYNEITIIR